jgi:hypothetical protein
MHHRNVLLFSLLFCMVVGSVPLVQMVTELHGGSRIQAADLPVDMVITPLRRAAKIGAAITAITDSLRLYRSAGVPSYEQAEELAAGAVTLRNLVQNVNRYTVDSTTSSTVIADSCVTILQELSEAADRGDSAGVEGAASTAIAVYGRLRSACAGAAGTVPGYCRAVLGSIFRETLFNRRYLRAYEKELEDRSVFMLAIRPAMQIVRYKLLGDAGVKAIVGKKGWLFYRPGIEYLYRPSVYDPRSRSVDYNDRAIQDDPVAVITDFRDQLAARAVELIVVIVPGKGSIYPDLLSDRITPAMRPSISSSTADIIGRLRAGGIHMVDLHGPLLNERQRDSLCGDSIYLARDTHWRPRGLLRAARTVADEVRTRSWYSEAHSEVQWTMDTVTVKRTGDIGIMTGLPEASFGIVRVSFPPEVTNCFPVWHNYIDSTGAIVRRVPFRDDFRAGRIVILGDSFSRIYQTDEPRGAGWVAHLARELSEPLGAIISDGGASTLVREKLARKAGILKGKKLVIWEFVERDLRYGAFGWKRVALP